MTATALSRARALLTVPAHDHWPLAYRPLRPGSLIAQVAVLIAAEILLFQAYSVHDSRFHWATHFLVGLLVTAAYQALFLLLTARPAPLQVLSVLGFHLVAMWPDLAFRGGLPHERWMDWVALGHISVHYMPGGDDTWLVLALAGCAGYVLLLTRWLTARTAEADAGLAPALGIAGSAVWRPQLDPTTTALAHHHHHRRLAQDSTGHAGPDVVLLHGLGGTSAVWEPVAARIAASGASATTVDLLGFGGSRRIGTRFSIDEQADVVARLLLAHGTRPDRPAHVVAHSWGAVVAARVVARSPGLVGRLTLVTPALFADRDRAETRFSGRSWLARRTVQGALAADVVCTLMCLLRPPLARLAPWTRRDVPPDVARGALGHSYPAYHDALTGLLDDQALRQLVQHPTLPVTLLAADDDTTVPPAELAAVRPGPQVAVVTVPGTHLLPLEDPDLVAQHVLAPPPAGPAGTRPKRDEGVGR